MDFLLENLDDIEFLCSPGLIMNRPVRSTAPENFGCTERHAQPLSKQFSKHFLLKFRRALIVVSTMPAEEDLFAR